MNIASGLYRLAQVIKWFGRVLGCIWFILLVTESSKSVVDGLKSGNEVLWVMFLSAFVLIAVTEVIAWILEGFANERRSRCRMAATPNPRLPQVCVDQP